MNQPLGSTPITKKTKSYGDPNVHDKYRCLPRLRAPLLGSEPLSTCPALGFTLGFACAASAPLYRGSSLTLALPFPFCFRAPYNVKQKSVDLDEEDVPFTPDEHKKRYALQGTTFSSQGQ